MTHIINFPPIANDNETLDIYAAVFWHFPPDATPEKREIYTPATSFEHAIEIFDALDIDYERVDRIVT